jgi:hypothetical protein
VEIEKTVAGMEKRASLIGALLDVQADAHSSKHHPLVPWFDYLPIRANSVTFSRLPALPYQRLASNAESACCQNSH